jgi:hypothetical protein
MFTIPYKLAVRFSYAGTPSKVNTPENFYHTDANRRMQWKFKLRRTFITNLTVKFSYAGTRRKVHTPEIFYHTHTNKRNATEIQTSSDITKLIFTMFPGSAQPLPRDQLSLCSYPMCYSVTIVLFYCKPVEIYLIITRNLQYKTRLMKLLGLPTYLAPPIPPTNKP